MCNVYHSNINSTQTRQHITDLVLTVDIIQFLGMQKYNNIMIRASTHLES